MKNQVKMGGFSTISKIAFRNIFRNIRRSIFCIGAIGVAVFFIIVMLSFINGMIGSIQTVVKTFESGNIIIYTEKFSNKKEFYPLQYPVVPPEEKDLDEFISDLEAINGIKGVIPRITSYATLTSSIVKHAILMGMDFEKENSVHYMNMKDKSNGLIEGRYPERRANGRFKNECIIGEYLANKMGVKIGDKIPMKIVSSQYSDKFYNPEVVGIFDYNYAGFDAYYIIIPFERMQSLATLNNKTQTLVVYTEKAFEDKSSINRINKEINNIIEGTNLTTQTWFENPFLAMMKMAQFSYLIIYMVFIIVASFLIVNTIIMIIHERIKEIGMMGSLGMTRREIVQVFFFEAIYLSIFGALAGTIVGGIFTFAFSFFPVDFQQLGGGIDMPVANIIYLKFSAIYLVEGFLFGVVVSSICTIFPSLKSAFVEPVEALRR